MYHSFTSDLLFGELNSIEVKKPLKRFLSKRKVMILVDENTHKHCLPILSTEVEWMEGAEIVEIQSGEQNKTIEIAVQIWETLASYHFNKNDALVVLGGGVLCDLGGFVAAGYKRGMHCVYIPTTLLAMVDAAYGGKTGIDFHQTKNLIGFFKWPDKIVYDVRFLNTLPEKEMLNGHAEMIKHAFVSENPSALEDVTKKDFLNHITIEEIRKSLEVKINIVEVDPMEVADRKKLNFGHTVGHALESYFIGTNEPLDHGVGVALGMMVEIFIAKELKMMEKDLAKELIQRIQKLFPVRKIESEAVPKIVSFMLLDKKNASNLPTFALLNSDWKMEIDKEVEKEIIEKALIKTLVDS